MAVTILDDNLVEGRLIDTYEKQRKRSCRMCKHFCRIKEDGDFRKIRRRGFCVLGKLEGDFSLYVSSSYAMDCPAFVLDDYNYETTMMEFELAEKWNEFRMKIEDGRTREARELKKVIRAMADYLKLENAVREGIAGIQAYRKAMALAYDHFVERHRNEFGRLWKRRAVNVKDYRNVLAAISRILEDCVGEKAGGRTCRGVEGEVEEGEGAEEEA